MKRKLKVIILAVLAVACFTMAAACTPKETVKLVDFENTTIDVGYGETYYLDLVAFDEDGNAYTLIAMVKNQKGENVDAVNGKFVVSEKTPYTVTYNFKKGGFSAKRTVTLNVVAKAKPIIKVLGTGGYFVPNMQFTIPDAVVTDYFDGELSYDYEVYQQNNGVGEKIEFDKENGTFTPTESGEYYVEYTAVNSYNVVGTARIELFVNTPESYKEIAIVNEQTHGIIYNNSITDQGYFAADSEELQAINGAYEGNAKRFKIWTNPGYALKSTYTADFFTTMAQYYNSVSMWIAVTGITGGNAYMMNDANTAPTSLQYLAAGQMSLKTNQDKWIKLVVPTEKMAEVATNGEYIRLFYIWCDNMVGDAYVYVGDIQFENLLDVSNHDINKTYMLKDDWMADGITGDYEGDAVKFVGGVNSGFIYKNFYSESELNELAKTYNTVTLNFAVNFIEGSFYLYTSGFEGIASPGQTNYRAANGNVGTWVKWNISMEDYIELVKANNFEFFRPWGGVANEDAYSWGIPTGTWISYYFGELEFSYVAPAVIRVESSNFANIYNPDVSNSYISASDLAKLNIAGDYTGNATRFRINNAATNGGYRITIPYTTAELNALKAEYNTVTTWVCVTGITANSLNINNTVTTNFGYVAGVKGFGTTPTWQKLSISIDAFIELIGEKGYCPLIATAHWSNGQYDAENGAYLYFGDMIFENIVAE